MLPLLAEARIQLPVPVERSIDTNLVTSAQLADSGFEEVLFDGPPHEVVLDGGLGDLLVEGDRFVVVLAFQRDKVSSLEPELVCECLLMFVRFCKKLRVGFRVPLRCPVLC